MYETMLYVLVKRLTPAFSDGSCVTGVTCRFVSPAMYFVVTSYIGRVVYDWR
jgi:hypothetical protein